MQFSGRLEAMMSVPTGGAEVSATTVAQTALSVTVPAADYFMSASGGLPGLCATLQSQLNDNVQGYPKTAAALLAAIGWGTWTSATAWLINETSGSLVPVLGPTTMTAVGTPSYGTGPRGGIDKSVGFDAAADGYTGGNVNNVGATDDLFVVWVGRNNTAGVQADVIGKTAATPRWGILREANSMGLFTTDATPDTVYPNATGVYVGSWHCGISYVDRGAVQVGIATQALVGGTPSTAAASSAVLGALTNAAAFSFGDGGIYRGTNSPDLAFVAVVTGSGVAANLHANIATALTNFANAVNAAWTVSPSTTDGRVSIGWSGYTTPTWSLAFTNTTLRDVLGFTADISGVTTTQVSTKQARGVWFPDSTIFVADSDPRLAPVGTNARSSIHQNGEIITFVTAAAHRIHRSVKWSHIPIDRIREQSATYANASWRTFWDDTQLCRGGLSWFKPSSNLLIIDENGHVMGSDMQTGGPTYGWQVPNPDRIQPMRVDPTGWDGRWSIEFPELIARDE